MKITAPKESNRTMALTMLAWIELCGSIGHTCQAFKVYVDGDGGGQIKLNFDDEPETKEVYENIKKKLLKEFDNGRGDLKSISFE